MWIIQRKLILRGNTLLHFPKTLGQSFRNGMRMTDAQIACHAEINVPIIIYIENRLTLSLLRQLPELLIRFRRIFARFTVRLIGQAVSFRNINAVLISVDRRKNIQMVFFLYRFSGKQQDTAFLVCRCIFRLVQCGDIFAVRLICDCFCAGIFFFTEYFFCQFTRYTQYRRFFRQRMIRYKPFSRTR